MKIKYIIFSYFILVLYSTSFSQINFGIGVGQQYRGLPGIRIGYNIKAIEPSFNIGLLGTANHKIISMGTGLSLYFHRKDDPNPMIRKKLSYNFNFFNSPDLGLTSFHSLSANLEFNSIKITSLQWRLGLGANYYLSAFSPCINAALFVELKDLKSKGFYYQWSNTFGKN